MKNNVIRIILYIILFITLFIIFNFSSQNGNKSGKISQKITVTFLNKIPQYKELEKSVRKKIVSRAESVIRKLAHFSIYTIVGMLLMEITITYNLKNSNRIIISLILGIVYAVSDEIHQSFSPGRTPKITDVYIDALGTSLGILIVLLGTKIYNKYKTWCQKKSCYKT